MINFDFSILLLFIISVATFLCAPGPVTLLVINTSLAHDFSSSIKTIIGTNAASLILIALSALVIQGVLILDENLLTVLKILGSLYLLYYAYTLILDILRKNDSREEKNKKSPGGFFRKGFAIGISNPKDIIFFISFFPQFINLTSSKTASLVWLTLIWILLDYSILSFYGLSAKKIIRPKIKNTFFIISAGLFLMIGLFSIVISVHDLNK
jgi:threonine/homoserine/homoserine lactone efflux protein